MEKGDEWDECEAWKEDVLNKTVRTDAQAEADAEAATAQEGAVQPALDDDIPF